MCFVCRGCVVLLSLEFRLLGCDIVLLKFRRLQCVELGLCRLMLCLGYCGRVGVVLGYTGPGPEM